MLIINSPDKVANIKTEEGMRMNDLKEEIVTEACIACKIVNHYHTTGRCSGPAHYDVSIRQAARVAFLTSSFKIFLTQTFPRCGAMCYMLPSRAMTQLFNGVNFVYRSVEVYLTFCSYLRVLVRIRNFYSGGRY